MVVDFFRADSRISGQSRHGISCLGPKFEMFERVGAGGGISAFGS